MQSNSKNYIISSVSLRLISIIFLISGFFVFLTTKDLRPESINNHIDYNIVTDLLVKLISVSNILIGLLGLIISNIKIDRVYLLTNLSFIFTGILNIYVFYLMTDINMELNYVNFYVQGGIILLSLISIIDRK
tara:strand:+ start:362 stop:760 length:399 start_codon:yes stop_codon:yes gene_type:complete